jgi:hypothetical protein
MLRIIKPQPLRAEVLRYNKTHSQYRINILKIIKLLKNNKIYCQYRINYNNTYNQYKINILKII